MNDFTTVFLFTNDASETFRGASETMRFGVLAIVMCVAVLGWLLFMEIKIKLREKVAPILVTVFWLLMGIGTFHSGLEEKSMFEQRYQCILDAYNNQQYKIAEGIVHVIHEEAASGHDDADIITVGGTQLEISHFVVSFGYKDTIAYNGVLREGVYARIYYIEDDWLKSDMILRIDLRN
jgi:hypothetical protein